MTKDDNLSKRVPDYNWLSNGTLRGFLMKIPM